MTRRHLYNAFDPLKPAAGTQYLESERARGGLDLVGRFIEHLDLTQGFRTFLLSGHIGSGKSSELRALATRLRSHGARRCLPVLVDAREYLDEYDAVEADLLLAIVAELADTLRQVDLELSDGYFLSRYREIRELLGAPLEFPEVAGSLGPVKAGVKLLRQDAAGRGRVREALGPAAGTLPVEVNRVLDQAREKLAARSEEPRFTDLVIILDNLDKLQRFEGRDPGAASQRELFLERAPVLTGLHAQVICTLPLRLARSLEAVQLQSLYGQMPMVLPMVRVFERDSLPGAPLLLHPEGTRVLEAVFRRRLGEDQADSPEAWVEPEAMEFLVRYSGGHMRTFVSMVRDACTYVEELPITLRAARRAVGDVARTFASTIPHGAWPLLARLELDASRTLPSGNPVFLELLENLAVLEYMNGDPAADPFSGTEPWYLVHPVVRELPSFRRALQSEGVGAGGG